MTTMTLQHNFVKHTITQVEALPGLEPTDPPVIVVDPEQQDLAEEDAVYGCNTCGQPMSQAYNTECPGEGNYDG